MQTKDQMDVIVKALDDYEGECGLPQLKNPCNKEELEQYFSMTRDQIEKLSNEDCGQIAYRLSQFAFHLQRLNNREHARLAWANAKLNDSIASEVGGFDKFMKHEMKISLLKQNNSAVKSVADILTYAEQRIQRLNFLSASIKNLADVLLANKRSKYV
jgi:hypothetical protein